MLLCKELFLVKEMACTSNHFVSVVWCYLHQLA
jgi:hypothetical protein